MLTESLTDLQSQEFEKLASGIHGEIATTISGYLFIHLLQNDTGRLFDSSTTFQIDPDQPRREPDVAYVSLARLPENLDDTIPLAPDLAVEIISGSDDWKEVVNKALGYLRAGVKLIWVVDPYTRSVFVFTPAEGEAFATRRGEDELSGGDILPGFSLKVRLIFEKAKRIPPVAVI